MHHRLATHTPLSLLLLCCSSLTASELHELPVTAVSVFKDGHALLQRQATLPVAADGSIHLVHDLQPVLGSVWASSDRGLLSLSAISSTRSEQVPIADRQALLEANRGRQLQVLTSEGRHSGRLRAVLAESIALETDTDTVLLLSLTDIESLQLLEEPVLSQEREQREQRLVLRLEEGGGQAQVRTSYLQQGIRWIPQYRVTLLDGGRARIELQAAIINDLIDLEDVSMELVVGVPRFDFADQEDPLALGEPHRQLQRQATHLANRSARFSNLLVTQVAADEMGPPGPAGPASAGADEDLFVFTLDDVTLAAGARMTVPVVSYEVSYQSVFVLDLPMTPPQEGRRHIADAQLRELARDLLRPQVEHRLRLHNDGRWPITTAPALIRSGERVLAQGTLRYTAPGAVVELPVTAAVDIAVEQQETLHGDPREARLPNGSRAIHQHIDGRITLTSHRGEPVRLRVQRAVPGTITSQEGPGTHRQQPLHHYQVQHGLDASAWWRSYSWPWWWTLHNSVGQLQWELDLAPGVSTGLGYSYRYTWLP